MQIDLHGTTEDRILKINFNRIGYIFTLSRSPGLCSVAEYIAKNVLKPGSTAASEVIRTLRETLKPMTWTGTGSLTITRIKRRVPELIVLLPFLWIR